MINKQNRQSDQCPSSQHFMTSSDFLSLLQSISKSQSQDSKQIQIQQLQLNISQIGDDNYLSFITHGFCKELLLQIEEGKTIIQKTLLDILLQITELGFDLVEKDEENNVFFEIFEISDLINKISEIFIHKINMNEKEKKNDQFSEFTIHLMQTFAFINKNKEINKNILDIYQVILRSQINKLVGVIKQFERYQNSDENQLKIENDELEVQMKAGIRTLKGLMGLLEDFGNQNYLIKKFKLHKLISYFIHVNCSSELHCPLIIKIPESKISQDLVGAALRILGQLSSEDSNMCQYLQDNHMAYEHAKSIIMNCRFNQSIQTKIINNKFSQSIINGGLQIFYNSILYYSGLCLQAASTHNLIKALISLSDFNRKIHYDQKTDIQSAQIRVNSNWCLNCIWKYRSIIIMKNMINEYKYVQSLIKGVGIGGGSEEQKNNVNEIAMQNIIGIYYNINKIKNQDQYKDQLAIQSLIKCICETIEEQGGIEEIQTHLYHSKLMRNDEMKRKSDEIIKYMINNKRNQTNI